MRRLQRKVLLISIIIFMLLLLSVTNREVYQPNNIVVNICKFRCLHIVSVYAVELPDVG